MTWVILTLTFLILTILATKKRAEYITKPLASAGFIGAAYTSGALESGYGMMIFAALILSFIGDVLLIPKTKGTFKIGLFSFLLAHIGFSIAFLIHGVNWYGMLAIPAVILAYTGLSVGLLPHVSEGKRAVKAYIDAISLMVLLAISTGSMLITTGAILFYLSDLCVARNAFIKEEAINKQIGLPLYYTAQLCLAFSVAA